MMLRLKYVTEPKRMARGPANTIFTIVKGALYKVSSRNVKGQLAP
jgi:hypothetical protein